MFQSPQAKVEWEALGLSIVPVIAQGERRLPIFHVDQLRGFLGMKPGEGSAPYQDLVAALERVLEGVERAVLQVPHEHWDTPTPNRGRDIRELSFNIHNPIRLMHASLDSGQFPWETEHDKELSRDFASTTELAEFCREIRLDWLQRAVIVEPEEAERTVQTSRGEISQHQLLDSQAWHAAQHLRQIYVFLREIGVEPAQELTTEDMAPITLGETVF